eukprot:GEZU01020200.1.p1 GENE.GEZU01020200.1~~GEZU01020200.1.p1  ORF type:complete len:413 (-),score=59.03 GEZU01020200.1:165-1403(-)
MYVLASFEICDLEQSHRITRLSHALLPVDTEIDWEAYMSEVGMHRSYKVADGSTEHFIGFLGGQWDYKKLGGQTGACVYPAGFVYLFALLHNITNAGENVRLAQYIFAFVYLALLATVFILYRRTKRVNLLVLILLCMSRRIHSIFVLRLFNDCTSMMLAYLSIYFFTKQKWSTGCFVFSCAVSIKMNILLFAPGLLLCLLKTFGALGTIPKLAICALTQVVIALPFAKASLLNYIKGSFDLGRQFFHIWSVNLKFVPEHLFNNKYLAISLLGLHLLFLFLFAQFKWCKHEGGILKAITMKKPGRLTSEHIVTVLFTSNFIGLVFARSLHYQFYVWYFHELPYLIWSIDGLPNIIRLGVLFGIEAMWNIFPSTPITSICLTLLHLFLLFGLLFASRPWYPYQEPKHQKEKSS